jgi:hypothetical protein
MVEQQGEIKELQDSSMAIQMELIVGKAQLDSTNKDVKQWEKELTEAKEQMLAKSAELTRRSGELEQRPLAPLVPPLPAFANFSSPPGIARSSSVASLASHQYEVPKELRTTARFFFILVGTCNVMPLSKQPKTF